MCRSCKRRAARSASGTGALQYALSMALQHAAHSGSVLMAPSEAAVQLVGATVLGGAGTQPPRPYTLPLMACWEYMPQSVWPREKKSAREGSREDWGEPALVAVAVAVRAETLGAVPREVMELERESEHEARLPLLSDARGLAQVCDSAECSLCHPTSAARSVGCSLSRVPPACKSQSSLFYALLAQNTYCSVYSGAARGAGETHLLSLIHI